MLCNDFHCEIHKLLEEAKGISRWKRKKKNNKERKIFLSFITSLKCLSQIYIEPDIQHKTLEHLEKEKSHEESCPYN